MKTIVLVGGGHSHLYCIKQLQKNKHPDMKWILLSSSKLQYYSGMFSGYAEGLYTEKDISIDLEKLTRNSAASFIETTVLSIDTHNQKILGSNGEVIDYDVVSFDIGSINKEPSIEGLSHHNVKIKPNYQFPRQIKPLQQSQNSVVIGGGAAGIEMALSLLAWRKKQPKKTSVTLIHSSPLLASAGKKASNRITKLAAEHGLTLVHDRVNKVTESLLSTENGLEIQYDGLLYLGGPKPPSLLVASKLPTDRNGFLLVNASLQSVGHRNLFGAGDCITISDHEDTPKNGVNAVRQGPVLFENITNHVLGYPLKTFTPQKYFLAILSTGHQKGFLTYGSFVAYGKWAWHLKDWIDRRFMGNYQ
ncbi:FAD-dependent oxidoreductase [Bacillus sp. 2205SS5-2]|uniref:FAD-dependent oxidoreductase n=1 Tax=Bacillus sp. 2205SS5-2 TaxID=3109031 RepID=UPI0030040846